MKEFEVVPSPELWVLKGLISPVDNGYLWKLVNFHWAQFWFIWNSYRLWQYARHCKRVIQYVKDRLIKSRVNANYSCTWLALRTFFFSAIFYLSNTYMYIHVCELVEFRSLNNNTYSITIKYKIYNKYNIYIYI